MSAARALRNRRFSEALGSSQTPLPTPPCAFTTADNTANLIDSMHKVLDNFGGEGAR